MSLTLAPTSLTHHDLQWIVFADDWGRHPSSAQHLIRCLLASHPSDRADSVLWVNTIGTRRPQLTLADARRVWNRLFVRRSNASRADSSHADHAPQPRVISPSMYPGFRTSWQRRFNARSMARAVHHALGPRDGRRRIVLTTLPITADLPGMLDVDHWIYYRVDDFSVWPGLDGSVMRDMEQQLLERVQGVVAVSEHLTHDLNRFRGPSLLLTHGIDLPHWTSPVRDTSPMPAWWTDAPKPRALFWGLIDSRLDVNWCRALVESRDFKGSLILLGPQQSPDSALHNLPRVLLPGAVSYHELPRFAHTADVLVMPYADLPVTRAMQPLKFKEYLATLTKPVVVRDLPATRPWADACDVASSADAFISAVQRALTQGLSAPQAQARERLRDESWDRKWQDLSGWVGSWIPASDRRTGGSH